MAYPDGMDDEPEMWICGYCGAEHDTEDEADQCCYFEPDEEDYDGAE